MSHSTDASNLPSSTDTQGVLQEILKGRKSWKTIDGHKEAVWPPYLEAALIKGLEAYRPDDSSMNRFLRRNLFLSKYILKHTGKHRTPKQIGSRLQHLRDTCATKDLYKLLYHGRRDAHPSTKGKFRTPSPSSSTSSQQLDCASPGDIPSSPPSDVQDVIQPSIVKISILPPNPTSRHLYSGQLAGATSTPHTSCPRLINDIDPTVTFVSPFNITADSVFSVFENGALVHSESSAVWACGSPTQDTGMYLYTSSLVPKFWHHICESADPSRYTIVQEVVSSEPSLVSPTLFFSALYQFVYPLPVVGSPPAAPARQMPYSPNALVNPSRPPSLCTSSPYSDDHESLSDFDLLSPISDTSNVPFDSFAHYPLHTQENIPRGPFDSFSVYPVPPAFYSTESYSYSC